MAIENGPLIVHLPTINGDVCLPEGTLPVPPKVGNEVELQEQLSWDLHHIRHRRRRKPWGIPRDPQEKDVSGLPIILIILFFGSFNTIVGIE